MANDESQSTVKTPDAHEWQFSILTSILVVAIVGLMASGYAAWQASSKRREAASQSKRLIEVSISIEMFHQENGRIPTEEEGLSVLVTPLPGRSFPYLDPAWAVDIWGNDVVYHVLGRQEENRYDLVSLRANGNDDCGLKDDVSLQNEYDRNVYRDYTESWWQVVGGLFVAALLILVFYAFREF